MNVTRLAHHLGKPKSELVIYDPFYCKGGVSKAWASLGIKNFIHEVRTEAAPEWGHFPRAPYECGPTCAGVFPSLEFPF